MICILVDNTDVCIGPECNLFSECWPDVIPCPKCLKGILSRLADKAEGGYQCTDCRAFLFDFEPSYPKSEEEYIQLH